MAGGCSGSRSFKFLVSNGLRAHENNNFYLSRFTMQARRVAGIVGDLFRYENNQANRQLVMLNIIRLAIMWLQPESVEETRKPRIKLTSIEEGLDLFLLLVRNKSLLENIFSDFRLKHNDVHVDCHDFYDVLYYSFGFLLYEGADRGVNNSDLCYCVDWLREYFQKKAIASNHEVDGDALKDIENKVIKQPELSSMYWLTIKYIREHHEHERSKASSDSDPVVEHLRSFQRQGRKSLKKNLGGLDNFNFSNNRESIIKNILKRSHSNGDLSWLMNGCGYTRYHISYTGKDGSSHQHGITETMYLLLTKLGINDTNLGVTVNKSPCWLYDGSNNNLNLVSEYLDNKDPLSFSASNPFWAASRDQEEKLAPLSPSIIHSINR